MFLRSSLAAVTAILGLAGTPAATADAGRTASLAAPPAAAAIDKRLRQATLSERPVEGFSAEGTRSSAWRRDGNLLKIAVEALGETGRRDYAFYFSGGELVAARLQRTDYGSRITQVPTTQPLRRRIVEVVWVEYRGGAAVRMHRNGRDADLQRPSEGSVAGELSAHARSFSRLMSAPEVVAAGCQWHCTTDWQGECPGFVCR